MPFRFFNRNQQVPELNHLLCMCGMPRSHFATEKIYQPEIQSIDNTFMHGKVCAQDE